MRFLVDAQLPRRLVPGLRRAGHDALHTRDLPLGNATRDEEIVRRSLQEQRVVVTKDLDFLHSFLLRAEPHKLLLVTTGNIPNEALERLLLDNLSVLVELLRQHDVVEVRREAVVVLA